MCVCICIYACTASSLIIKVMQFIRVCLGISFIIIYIYICTFATSSLVLTAFFFFWLLFLYHISFLLHDLVFLTYE